MTEYMETSTSSTGSNWQNSHVT